MSDTKDLGVTSTKSKEAEEKSKHHNFLQWSFTFFIAFLSITIAYGIGGNRNTNAGEQGSVSSVPSTAPYLNACFTVLQNGYLAGDDSHKACVSNFENVDDLIFQAGKVLYPTLEADVLTGTKGAKLYKANGCRVYKLRDIEPHDTLFVVPVGRHFFWPLGEVGQTIRPGCLQSPVPGKDVVLEQLSLSPRVFTISNFITPDEIDEILSHNKPRVSRSGVGYKGQYDYGDRTSSTSWDGQTASAKRVSARSFQVLGWDVEPEIQDTLQVLNYKPGQWYKPHLDSFSSHTHQYFDPAVNNGTNRLATVFVYLSDVEEGGDTVFPLSTTHRGYRGDRIVRDGTVDVPGYIDNADAHRACNYSSSALRTRPKAGDAIVFYSQTPEGQIDPYSLHGGCPPVKGEKWSANVWLWNRPKPDQRDRGVLVDAGSEPSEEKHPDAVEVVFENGLDFAVTLAWVDQVTGKETPWGAIQGQVRMNSYRGHVFRFENKERGFMKEVRIKNTAKDGDVIDPAKL